MGFIAAILPFSLFWFGVLIAFVIFAGFVAIYAFYEFQATATDSSASVAYYSRGVSEGQSRIQAVIAHGVDADVAAINSSSKYSGAKTATGPVRSWVNIIGMLSLVVALAVPVSSSAVDFGEIKGRFPCDSSLPCGRDSSFFEMHMKIIPPMDRDAAISMTPWAFAPWDADDTLSTPITCDPRKSRQCYIMNNGTLRVEVETSRPYWRYDVSRYPVYEFASGYKINTTVHNGTINATNLQSECEVLIGEDRLFSDNGPCWQHKCENGSTTVVTETVGLAPGCGSFAFQHPFPRLTTSLRVRMFDIGTKRRTEVVIPDVYDGVQTRNVFHTLHVLVHNFTMPGGRSWQPPPPMHGELVVCDWRKSWMVTDLRGNPGGYFLDNMWYYAPPAVLNTEYAHRGCGMNGVALHEVTQRWTGVNCSDTISFADGACLPATPPISVLNGVVSAVTYTPPRWNGAKNNMFIHQTAQGEKMLMRMAEPDDFVPGEISYNVVLRVSNMLAMTDAEIVPIPYPALCIEYDALQCIIDPLYFTVKFEGVLSNLAWQVPAKETTVNISCTYDDGARISNVALTEQTYINYIQPGGFKSFIAIFDLPEEGIDYSSGEKSARLLDTPQFKCTVQTTSPLYNITSTFKWTGSVDCAHLVRKVYRFTDDLCPCNRTNSWDVFCRVEWNCTDDSDFIFFMVCGAIYALDIALIIFVCVHVYGKKSDANDGDISTETKQQLNEPAQYGTGVLPNTHVTKNNVGDGESGGQSQQSLMENDED